MDDTNKVKPKLYVDDSIQCDSQQSQIKEFTGEIHGHDPESWKPVKPEPKEKPPARKGGRESRKDMVARKYPSEPIELSEAQLQMLERESAYLNFRQLAALVGVSRETMRLMYRGDWRVANAIERGRAKKVSLVSRLLSTAMSEGDVQAMKFYLERRGDWKESKHMLLEETEKDSAPMQSIEEWYSTDYEADPKVGC